MDISKLERIDETCWRIPATGKMRVPVLIYADEDLIRDMDDKVAEQAGNVASLPGIVGACYVMPDAHWGYGFPIGGVAAFDPAEGGVISAGGVGFDISCGVRTLTTGLKREEVEPLKKSLAEALFIHIPAGVGSKGSISLNDAEMDAMLKGGATWAVKQGYGREEDLERIEEHGCMAGADPAQVSKRARERQRREMGTLGSGNHYLEVQVVEEIFNPDVAKVFGLEADEVVVTIHCGSRGLGHQIGSEYLKLMQKAAKEAGIELPDRELACAPIRSPVGQRYLGAMRAGINCALANRQIITHLVRKVFAEFFPDHDLKLIYDVSHNTCKEEEHEVGGKRRRVFVHRKGATRAFGPGHPALPEAFRLVGQPVIIGGSMGTGSYILVGTTESERRSLSSACHGAGRCLSRRQATKTWKGQQVIAELERQGIIVCSPSMRGVAEEAPQAYKPVDAVVRAADKAGLARLVARLRPLVCIKG
ncbi:tRNA-splicing ligase RtcB [Methylomarinovum caldicuralii]|uniref:tRNA-splicing ligase RtcB n=1 Tax=Methylomarinovum caldicuralii TaxID=438856 RepID=A0AAU9BQZ2_9GAMM|nr:RtcB family protein [Methylomarinovum caldicuralii]BCX81183.1 tRNA-splicing ligase RtcB [Methylomarinovum caldicuralii]